MCGIAGIYAFGSSASLPADEEVLRMRDAMASRGPDGEGIYREPAGRLVLGHRRLSIIDPTDRSAQPMASHGGRFVISFNGEIYNYAALRDALIRDGAQLASRGDTEVLLHLYATHGAGMLRLLEGMYAMAIWDAQRRELFVARDGHGIKPLYYSVAGGVFRFASTVRAVLASGAVSRDPDPAGLAGYLAWGHIPGTRTAFRGIQALPAGSHLHVRGGAVEEPTRHWSVASVYETASRSPMDRRELDELVRAEVSASVKKHLVADVDVGLFLSAGVDSTALLGLAAEHHAGPIHAVTLAFEEFLGSSDDEAPIAAESARLYGARHHVVRLGRETVDAGMSRFLQAMDQPTVDGLNTYWVSHAMRQTGVKAALSGLGGDELFGGYPSFRRYVGLRALTPLSSSAPVNAAFSAALRCLPTSRRASKYAYAAEAVGSGAGTYHLLRGVFTPDELRHWLQPDLWAAAASADAILGPVRDGWERRALSSWSQIAVAEQSSYMRSQLLRDADWASMAHGLEIRVPLVDARLTERVGPAVAATDGRWRKQPLWRAPRRALPRAVARRAKTGFALPMREWTLRALDRSELPLPPSWFMRIEPARAASALAASLRADEIHWSRPWALLVLGAYLSSTQANP